MASIQELQEQYENLNERFDMEPEAKINPECLLAFDYEYPGQDAEVAIDSDEFAAVCPWTGLPDYGTIEIRYVPNRLCIELKSLKYYLFSYTNVGIVQEHAANRILQDLVKACDPLSMEITLDYNVRGGLHTKVKVRHEKS
ncbi:MAG: NADPH-dependent 7-cyano-7-deazaguanine reductase QueF [Chloroflexi bacterium]|nr:NADPH-dependent 7-cyano-7-deazaguanine reductase QueF [Chloroflexota bacterium]